MKKSFLFVAALALIMVACEPNEPVQKMQVADFENIVMEEPDSVLHLDRSGLFSCGNFLFHQEVSMSDGGIYYFGNIVSSKRSNIYNNDRQNDMSAVGGAHGGKNFVVWTSSYNGLDDIWLREPSVVPGMYVCNTPWVIKAIKEGDGMSIEDDGITVGAPFGPNDYFLLVIHGELNGKAKPQIIEVELAKGTDVLITDWTYVDLSLLGEVDRLTFVLRGSKQNSYGMTTPAYFAFDDLGAEN